MGIFKIELGAKVRDVVTRYEGIVIARTEWLYGCVRYVVQSQELKDGKPVDSHVVDEAGLEILVPSLITGAKDAAVEAARGGPRNDPARGQGTARWMARPETGAMKFADDWRGIFIRGDQAFFYAQQVLGHLAALEAMNSPMAYGDVAHYLRQLGALLLSADERRQDTATQHMKPFDECVDAG